MLSTCTVWCSQCVWLSLYGGQCTAACVSVWTSVVWRVGAEAVERRGRGVGVGGWADGLAWTGGGLASRPYERLGEHRPVIDEVEGGFWFPLVLGGFVCCCWCCCGGGSLQLPLGERDRRR